MEANVAVVGHIVEVNQPFEALRPVYGRRVQGSVPERWGICIGYIRPLLYSPVGIFFPWVLPNFYKCFCKKWSPVISVIFNLEFADYTANWITAPEGCYTHHPV